MIVQLGKREREREIEEERELYSGREVESRA